MNYAVDWFYGTYSVKPVQGNLKLSKTYCASSTIPIPVPTSYQTTGIPDCDLVLFVTGMLFGVFCLTSFLPGRPVDGTTLAFANECAKDQKSRAIAGQINFNPNALSTSDDNLVINLFILLI